MGERELQDDFKTIDEVWYQDPDNPGRGRSTRHSSATGEEPVNVSEETLVSEGKIESGQVQQEVLSYRLDELTKDYYMFSLAPIYLACLWDEAKNEIKFDLIYRFGVEMKMAKIPKVVQYQSPVPLFDGNAGIWDHLLQGLPRENNLPYLFGKWMEQLIFVRREKNPVEYWRVNRRVIKIQTPTVVSAPAEVEVFLPTGLDKRLDLSAVRADGVHTYTQLPPEDWVTEEAMRYFGEIEA